MDATLAEIVDLVDASEKDDGSHLFEMIGKNNPDALYGLPQTTEKLVAAGRVWFDERSATIKKFVCPKVDSDALRKPLSEDLVGAVFAYIAETQGKALAIYLTAIVLKKLVAGWCGESEIEKYD